MRPADARNERAKVGPETGGGERERHPSTYISGQESVSFVFFFCFFIYFIFLSTPAECNTSAHGDGDDDDAAADDGGTFYARILSNAGHQPWRDIV